MKVELEYINGQKVSFKDVLDVVFCTYDIEIYHRGDDVTVIENNKIKSVKVTEL